MKEYYAYIMTNASGTLYVGVTNDLARRIYEHKNKLVPGFTARYNLTRLVYYEAASDAVSAIAREKQLKGWLRKKKVVLIQSVNPRWEDLSLAWLLDQEETLRGVYPERDSSVASLLQNDRKRRTQGDKEEQRLT